MTKQDLLTKKNLMIGGVSLFVLLLLGYLFLLPAIQVNGYKNAVKSKYADLQTNVQKATDVLDSETFVSIEVETSQIQSDVKKGKDAVKNAEHTLGLVQDDLTGFSALPLLQWNSKYKAAKTLKENEQKYVAETKAYLKDLKSVLAYYERGAEVQQNLTNFQSEVALADEQSETWPQYGSLLEAPVKKLEEAVQTYSKLQVPASLKEMYDYELTFATELLDLYKKEVQAAKADNEDLILDLTVQQETKGVELMTKIEELNGKFVSDSSLRKQADKLQNLDRAIDSDLNKL